MSDAMNDSVWLITGSSAGLGLALAQRVVADGGRVVATARATAALQALRDSAPDRVELAVLDVCDAAQTERAVAQAMARFGRIDVLVNSAGYGLLGALEECSLDEIRQQLEVNLLGLIGVTRAVLPVMRAGGKGGVIVNFSSIAGILGFAGSSAYCTSKWAVEGLSESLAQELAPFGIGVLIVEPGPFRTDFAGRSIREAEAVIPAYANAAATRAYSASLDGAQSGDPVRAAACIVAAVADPARPLRLILGAGAFEAVHDGLSARMADVERSRTVAAMADFPA